MYGLSQKDGVYYITESYLTGKQQEHRVDYTLGLATLPSGRIIVLWAPRCSLRSPTL